MVSMNMTLSSIVIHLLVVVLSGLPHGQSGSESHQNRLGSERTDLLQDQERSLLLVSTLDGSFIGVDQQTGDVRWKVKDEPTIRMPINSDNSIMPMFLPDPKDGSLYIINKENALKKLPFTIQQLVASSPCQSTDGIFYTGKKMDSWFSMNWQTGEKEPIFSFDQPDITCPATLSPDEMFIGKAEYNIVMHDNKHKERRWNVTYVGYTSTLMSTEEMKNYKLRHFTGSSSGRLATFENAYGSLLWTLDVNSPIIGLYLKQGDVMVSVPFTSLAEESLLEISKSQQAKNLFPTLYIGRHSHGMYAFPSLTTAKDVNWPPLLDGPKEEISGSVIAGETETNPLFGHHRVPDFSPTRLLQIGGRSDLIIQSNLSTFNRSAFLRPTAQSVPSLLEEEETDCVDNTFPFSFVNLLLSWVKNQENLALKFGMIVILAMMTIMFLYLRAQVRQLKESSRNSSNVSFTTSIPGSITAIAEELPDGTTKVGKITFKVSEILGKGCEGTFVFRGEFDNRPVAVKRLLPECFTVADREVCLLRESDEHMNVIRYFCTEQDKQFRYIALELCATTLYEYCEKGTLKDKITPLEILLQATAGIEHLHSLNIVHRDIKPQNVLLSIPCNQSGSVRAMISDFGLCKKLQSGRSSFSKRSGIAGTDGWIAPEMIANNTRTTYAVDIFSLGCVFYYVLTDGKHPYGDSIHRQANIMNKNFKISGISDILFESLISRMISHCASERPPASVIKVHPVFWDKSHILNFLQDISDRLEKEKFHVPVMIELEKNSLQVIKGGDWRLLVDEYVASDLRKYRNYRGESLRDLLRALRNKKHHYRELPVEAQLSLGSIPDEFVDYWLKRFPRLLYHTWSSMQFIKHESSLVKYYDKNYMFPKPKTEGIPEWLQICIDKELELEKQSSNSSAGKFSPASRDSIKEDSPKSRVKSSKVDEPNWRLPSAYIPSKDCDNISIDDCNENDTPRSKPVKPRYRRRPKVADNVTWCLKDGSPNS
nr:PREDICTED: serine/threonine-protein kinase/endoribonuclease IRE1-like [Bemisia tabaci]